MFSMRQEARLIEAVFAQHKVACVVQPPPASYTTAALRLYRILRGAGVTVNRVTALADEIDEALTAARRQPVRCRFDRLPLRLEVPRPDPQLQLLPDVLQRLGESDLPSQRLLTLVGEGHAFGHAETLLLDLNHPNSPHFLLAGTTGSGKTNLLAGLVLSLAYLHSPQDLALVIIDPKGQDLLPCTLLPHLATPVITDAAEAVEALRCVVAEMEERKVTAISGQPSAKETAVGDWPLADGQKRTANRQKPIANSHSPRLVIAIDEIADLMDVAGSEVEACVKRILQVGRGKGIHVLGATQKPLSSVIGSIVKANFPVRLVGKVASGDDARVAAGIPNTDAERLPGLGSFLLVQGGNVQRIQSYFLPDTVMPTLAAAVRTRWQGMETRWRLPEPRSAAVAAVQIPSATQPVQAPDWLAAAVMRYVTKHGKLPSQRAVQRTYQEQTGQMLAWETIRSLLQHSDRDAGV